VQPRAAAIGREFRQTERQLIRGRLGSTFHRHEGLLERKQRGRVHHGAKQHEYGERQDGAAGRVTVQADQHQQLGEQP